MNWQFWTKIVLVAILAVGTAYDLAAYCSAGGDATISRLVLRLALEWPILAFVLGVFAGHFFWPQVIPSIARYFSNH